MASLSACLQRRRTDLSAAFGSPRRDERPYGGCAAGLPLLLERLSEAVERRRQRWVQKEGLRESLGGGWRIGGLQLCHAEIEQDSRISRRDPQRRLESLPGPIAIAKGRIRTPKHVECARLVSVARLDRGKTL